MVWLSDLSPDSCFGMVWTLFNMDIYLSSAGYLWSITSAIFFLTEVVKSVLKAGSDEEHE